MIFCSFGLILSITLTLIYRKKSDEKNEKYGYFQNRVSPTLHRLNNKYSHPLRLYDANIHYTSLHQHVLLLVRKYAISGTSIFNYFFIILNWLSYWLTLLFFRSPDNVTTTNITIFKGISAAANVLFIVTWVIACAFNKASISDMDLDPEDIETEGFSDDETRHETEYWVTRKDP